MRRILAVAALTAALAASLTGCRTAVQLERGDWTVECLSISVDACRGVAAVFVNNLARHGEAIREESNGRLTVTDVRCPSMDGWPLWADPSACWRAEAATTDTPRACMLFARHQDPSGATPRFGQVGGDEFTGLAGAPAPGMVPC